MYSFQYVKNRCRVKMLFDSILEAFTEWPPHVPVFEGFRMKGGEERFHLVFFPLADC